MPECPTIPGQALRSIGGGQEPLGVCHVDVAITIEVTFEALRCKWSAIRAGEALEEPRHVAQIGVAITVEIAEHAAEGA